MVPEHFNVICGLNFYTYKGTYTGELTDKYFVIPSQNCGKNHYVVDIPNDISLFEFFEMNLEFENGKMKSLNELEQIDGKSFLNAYVQNVHHFSQLVLIAYES